MQSFETFLLKYAEPVFECGFPLRGWLFECLNFFWEYFRHSFLLERHFVRFVRDMWKCCGLILFWLGVYLMFLGNISEKHHGPVAIVSLRKGFHITEGFAWLSKSVQSEYNTNFNRLVTKAQRHCDFKLQRVCRALRRKINWYCSSLKYYSASLNQPKYISLY